MIKLAFNLCSIHPISPLFPVPQSREELLSAGLSSQAADGILRIGAEAEKKGAPKNPLEAIGAGIQLLKDLDTFIKTQSKEDQNAYAVLLEQKKNVWEAEMKGKK